MTDDWDFYFCQVEDKPASMYLDLGAIDQAPNERLPYLAYIRLPMNAPREDGLSSQEEFDTLIAVEDHCRAHLVDADTDFVGRCTTGGYRDYFFYTALPWDWVQRVAVAMGAYPAYQFEADSREEPDWSTYLSYLYPSDADRQTMENRRVCAALESQGDSLAHAREIDHWAYFPDAASRDAFVAEAAAMGFMLREVYGAEGELGHAAQVWRRDTPSYQAIDGITLTLFHIAERLGGDYDGWESVVVA